MDEDIWTAKRYQQHADELRAIAGNMKDEASRTILLNIAEDYERMASSRERIDATERILARKWG